MASSHKTTRKMFSIFAGSPSSNLLSVIGNRAHGHKRRKRKNISTEKSVEFWKCCFHVNKKLVKCSMRQHIRLAFCGAYGSYRYYNLYWVPKVYIIFSIVFLGDNFTIKSPTPYALKGYSRLYFKMYFYSLCTLYFLYTIEHLSGQFSTPICTRLNVLLISLF